LHLVGLLQIRANFTEGTAPLMSLNSVNVIIQPGQVSLTVQPLSSPVAVCGGRAITAKFRYALKGLPSKTEKISLAVSGANTMNCTTAVALGEHWF
jgi:hypothetical protein